jgi:hypothetical protein
MPITTWVVAMSTRASRSSKVLTTTGADRPVVGAVVVANGPASV